MTVKRLDRGVAIHNPRLAQQRLDRLLKMTMQPGLARRRFDLAEPRRTASSLITRLIPKSAELTESPRSAVRCAYRQRPASIPSTAVPIASRTAGALPLA